MKLYKKAERTIKVGKLLGTFRECDWETKNLGRWCKWKELKNDSGRLQVKFDVFEIKKDDITVYLMSDSLDRVAAPTTADKKEVIDWLKEHGYKPEKQWYLEDYGMDEETWNAWNNAE